MCAVCLVATLCLTLYDLTDCSPPGSFVHGVLQARILGWVAISFSRGASGPRDQIKSLASPALARGFVTTPPPGKPYAKLNVFKTKDIFSFDNKRMLMLIIVNKKILRLCIDYVFLSENILNILFHCLQNDCTKESASSPITDIGDDKQNKPKPLYLFIYY